jgi:hypothetical protein
MRILATIIAVAGLCFLVVLGFYWMRDGSLESAGAKVGAGIDKTLAKVDSATEPLQEKMGEVGDATKKSVDRATDGDDRT